jgi:hypothetical protein
MALPITILQRGLRSAQPLASSVLNGTLYDVMDENVIEQSTGAAWVVYLKGISSGGGGLIGPRGKAGKPGKIRVIPGPQGVAGSGGGTVIQFVSFQTGAQSSGTTTIPIDDTIPQITEGNEFMTLAITPGNVINRLKIDVVWYGAVSIAFRNIIVALFQDALTNALASGVYFTDTAGAMLGIRFSHHMLAGTISPITFRVRAGCETSGTVSMNGNVSGRFLGGSFASSISVTEMTP